MDVFQLLRGEQSPVGVGVSQVESFALSFVLVLFLQLMVCIVKWRVRQHPVIFLSSLS